LAVTRRHLAAASTGSGLNRQRPQPAAAATGKGATGKGATGKGATGKGATGKGLGTTGLGAT